MDIVARLEVVERQIAHLARAVSHLAASMSEDARVRRACQEISDWEPNEIDVARDDALRDSIEAWVRS